MLMKKPIPKKITNLQVLNSICQTDENNLNVKEAKHPDY